MACRSDRSERFGSSSIVDVCVKIAQVALGVETELVDLDAESRVDTLDGGDQNLTRQRPGETVQLLALAGVLELQEHLRALVHQAEDLLEEAVEDLVRDLAAYMPGADEIRPRRFR